MSNIIKFLYPQGCENILKDVLPIPAVKNVPQWYKKLEHKISKLTAKGCMPFLDTLTAGYILKMPQDFYIKHNHKNEETGEQDSFYKVPLGKRELEVRHSRINLNVKTEVHPPFQLEGSPLVEKNKNLPFYKILNPFVIKTPPGYSCLFVPPLNNEDDRFEILPGIVDTDSYSSEINFPFVINGDKYPNLETTIEMGTPYVQVIPFKRENWKMVLEENKDTIYQRAAASALKLIHTYKKLFWFKKRWD